MATRDDDDGRGDCNRAEGADITCWHVVAVWWESQLSTSPLVFFFFLPLQLPLLLITHITTTQLPPA